MTKKVVLTVCFFTLIAGWSHSTEPAQPPWVASLIRTFQAQPVGKPPQSIWGYDYKGETVYYVPSQCCDQFSKLFNSNGNLICAPDGGDSGRGDDRCPDFFAERKNEVLVWRDPRTR